jgi:hypothetical protein
MVTVIVILSGVAVEAVLPDAPQLPPNGQRVEADEAMLRRIGSLAFLSIAGGQLLFDEAAQQAARDQEAAALEALRGDTLARELSERLRAATPSQIDAYVDAQVTDLASARTMFKRILLVLAYELRR